MVEKRATTGGGEQRVHWRPLTDSTQPQQLDWGGREARGKYIHGDRDTAGNNVVDLSSTLLDLVKQA